VLAAFTVPVLSQLKLSQYRRVARGELEVIQTALENYKAKYGSYPPANAASAKLPQLYYELAGTTYNSANDKYTTLDGRYILSGTEVNSAYGVGGFVNVSKGSGDDVSSAKNFLVSLNPRQYYYAITNDSHVSPGVATTVLITSVGGPDKNYLPLGVNTEDLNPIRYAYPGVHNPGSYDLWIQFQFKGKTNLVCNWSRQIQINSSLP